MTDDLSATSAKQAIVQTLNLAHQPPSYQAHVALFTSVENASFLRQQLLAGNTDFEYAFVDASTILSTTHILAAVSRAVNDLRADRLRSRNVHSEIVFSLSANNNIAESFRRFGITDMTTSLLAIKVATPETPISAEIVSRHLTENVKGSPLEFTNATIAQMTNWATVRKNYKLGGSKENNSEAEVTILGLVALKGS